ncbi:N-acetyl-gamma-glutamyl-phosphate reductase [candidate division WOR-1 bacterium RIFCSPHIGHO2_01_FULL_53_15]|uniref:N-acetyl-gamma-glutamyl-phosphate reductase n=1 Tax=candidate division WOR-1 bacterium RIFCSPHIGHO2_01_FULL_53_15 TaxID=1802564 RepID=A0A1F4Q294_UNCSA|nr:MAG: N-acetyl-gamma-glutamyl-phosphate reductase [candidate division WOR-1 bacterium RIFCSPHIGHO2_01_FULL_53_15]OGC13669.1 MAG: N-acetyl-gamma-glutamyl-phosphate reductase [candidate division WOR-1 bacterium RIFCSPHIGHO2_02_FULL_53_26]
MIKAGIVGAGGYAGATLINILLRHPEVKIVWLMSEDAHKGKKIADLYPHLTGEIDLACQTLDDLDKNLDAVDLVFLALPHGIAINYVPKIIDAGKKVVDLGADYRFSDNKIFKQWYGIEHKTEKYLSQAVFGLPELFRSEIKKTKLIGNPGCYPTASILGAAPLVKNGLIELDSIIVDAKSGITGAGRGATLKTHYCERNEGLEAYAVTNHRHMGEIEYQLSRISGHQLNVTFVPHLAPMSRGILATIYAKAKQQVDDQALTALYKEFYKDEPFVKIFDDKAPNTKYVAGTNNCVIAVQYNECTGRIIVLSVIDNLVKGAAGQAVQNMNLICGFPETTGLKQITVFP